MEESIQTKKQHILHFWEELHDNNLDFAVSYSWLEQAIMDEYERNKQQRLLSLSIHRAKIFDTFANASAETRDFISNEIYLNRLVLDDFGLRHHSFSQLIPLRQALRENRLQDVLCLVPSLPEHLVWFALCEFPFHFSFHSSLLAIRILPGFCSVSTTMCFQEALEKHIETFRLSLSDAAKTTEAEFNVWMALVGEPSPLRHIEFGVHWLRFILWEHRPESIPWVVEKVRGYCPDPVLEREVARRKEVCII